MISDEEMKNLPSEGTSVGTPIYMSPQILTSEPYTIKCDVWSCGIVFYRILYRLFPWEKTDHLQILIDRMHSEITFPPHIQVEGWLKDTIRGMLTVSEADRLSIKEVVERIKKYCPNLMDME